MSVVAYIRKLVERGFSYEDALTAAEVYEDRPAEPSKGAVRQRRWRAKQPSQTSRETPRDDGDARDAAPPETRVPPAPPSQTQTPHPPIVPPPLAKPNGFARFWEAYPNKTGKRAAEAAFAKAVKRIDGDPLASMLPAIQRAKQSRRWREDIIPNPATWLNQDRWLDGVETAGPEPPPGPITAAELARRHRHFADTGEWPDHWGEKPKAAA